MISVSGKQYHPTRGALFDTYVNELKASHLLYVVFGLLRPDVTIEPGPEVSSGCPNDQYEAQLLEMMANSKYEAEAAALYATKHSVKPETWGPEIEQVSCGVPAATKLKAGDRILAVNGQKITGRNENGQPISCGKPPYTVDCSLFAQIRNDTIANPPGSIVHLTILRGGKMKHVAVRTVHAVNGVIVHSGGQALIGIVMGPALKFPVKINVDSGNVGGPSAGLAFTLGIVQQLTHHDLTNGNKVAVTGTMTFEQIQPKRGPVTTEALVGAIGGARQKAIAAQAAGARYFLVPYSNYNDALSAHAHGLKIIPVRTLTQALQILKALPSPGKATSSGTS